jgi:hypothetical protein
VRRSWARAWLMATSSATCPPPWSIAVFVTGCGRRSHRTESRSPRPCRRGSR